MPLAILTDSDRTQQLRRLFRKHALLLRAIFITALYSGWILLFRLLVLTFITYLLISPNSHFQDIVETYGSNEVSLMGLAAVVFVILVRWLNPLIQPKIADLFSPQKIEKFFLKGFLHGSVLAFGVSLAFLLSGYYRYLGFFIRFDEAAMAMTNVLIRIAGLLAMVYFEEYLFRKKIMTHLTEYYPQKSQWISGLFAALLTSVFYCIVKMIQFDLGIMHIMTLFLISLALSFRTLVEGDFYEGAGFWAALLIVFQPLLSLPVLGNEFSGVLLIKFQNSEIQLATTRFLTGGAGGPISSFAFQLVLLLDIVRGILKYKKMHLNPRSPELE